MNINTREDLHLLVNKLPDSEVEKVLNLLKQANNSTDKSNSDKLLREVAMIFKVNNNL